MSATTTIHRDPDEVRRTLLWAVETADAYGHAKLKRALQDLLNGMGDPPLKYGVDFGAWGT